MIHKGQLDKVQWHRPSPSSTITTKSNATINVEHEMEMKDKIVLERGDNGNTAHLANLMTSYLTISPNLRQLDNLVVRGTVNEVGKKVEKGRGRRRVHKVMVPEEVMRSMESLRGSASGYSRSGVSQSGMSE
jgi:hypothetical protein